MKASLFAACLFCLCLVLPTYAQDDFVISRAKSIKTEYTPKPKDFKIGPISWGDLGEDCVDRAVEYGAWFRFYPLTDKIKVTVSTGYNWGDLGNPVIFVAVIDTLEGASVLTTLGCKAYDGALGDYALEVRGLRSGQKHYLLIGGAAKKQKFALYLTEKFDPTSPAPHAESLPDEDLPATSTDPVSQAEPSIPAAEPEQKATDDSNEATAIIIGRVRKKNGKPMKDSEVHLLDDGLTAQGEVTTDASGVFRFEGVHPDRINLVKVMEPDDKVVVDMFIYDPNGNIIGRSIALGHQLYSFREQQGAFSNMNILTERDVVVMVKRGKSTMTGKVVDRATYLIGKPNVRVGLYTPKKRLLRTAFTDKDGTFLFTQLDDQDYIVKVDHNPSEDYVEIILTDDQNEPYAISTSQDQALDGYFRFRKLPMDYHDMDTVITKDQSGFQHHYYTMLSEEEPGIPYELHSIEFAVGASTLPGVNDELDQLARELIESPSVHIKVDGHTDDQGSERMNRKLSLARAQAVKNYLVNRGVDPSRIRCEGFGSKHPIAENDTERGRSANRRVEFSIEVEQ